MRSVYDFTPGFSPVGTFSLFQEKPLGQHFGAFTKPPNILLGADFLNSGLGGIGTCWSDPDDPGSTDPTEVPSWGTDYVILRADNSAFANLTEYPTLYVKVTSKNALPPNHRLLVNYITYSTNAYDLYNKGSQAIALGPEVGSNGQCHATSDFSIAGFGQQVKGLAMTISLVEEPVTVDYNLLRVPYTITWSTHPIPTELCAQSNPPLVTYWGHDGTGAGEFKVGTDVATDGTFVYVSDSMTYTIQKFTLDGQFVFQWSTGSYRPMAIWTRGGKVFVSEKSASDDRIEMFSTGGATLAHWGSHGSDQGQFDDARDIGSDTNGNIILVADTNNDRIQKFNRNGNTITYGDEWGGHGFGPGQFFHPTSVVVDEDGNFAYVIDQTSRIQKLNFASGDFVSSWRVNASCGVAPAYSLAMDHAGMLVVVDPDDDVIIKFDTAGEKLGEWGKSGSNLGFFDNPVAVAFEDALGHAFVMDSGNHRIQRFGYSPNTGVPEVQAPSVMPKVRAYPNPFTSATSIQLENSGKGQGPNNEAVKVRVFDLSGRLITTMGLQGDAAVSWDGRNSAGVAVPSGVYCIQAVGKFGTANTKVLKIGR